METLGDAVYMVAGGVPDRNDNHAVNVAGLAIELVEKAASLIDPVSGENLQLRAGTTQRETYWNLVYLLD